VTLDPRLDPDRCEIGVLSDEQFAAALEQGVREFYAEERRPGKSRRRRRRRVHPVAQVEPDTAPAFDLAELRQ
jgi:hypothetical protein